MSIEPVLVWPDRGTATPAREHASTRRFRPRESREVRRECGVVRDEHPPRLARSMAQRLSYQICLPR